MAALVAAALAPAAQSAPRDPVVYFLEPLYHHLDTLDLSTIPYAPVLADLARRDRAYAVASGTPGALDFNPLCGCQNLDRYHLRGMQGSEAHHLLKVVVTFQVALQSEAVTLDLARIGDGYAIADVHSPRVASLRAYLADAVPKEEATLRTSPRSP